MRKVILCSILLLAALNVCAETEYYITLKFTQTSYTLNVWQHVKDSANAFSFTFPTTKRFYDSLKVGQVLDSKFKWASLILNKKNNIGRRKIIVEDKFTKEVDKQ